MRTQDRTRKNGSPTRRTAERGEGAHAEERRTRAAAGIAWVRIDKRIDSRPKRERDARGPLPWTLAAPRLHYMSARYKAGCATCSTIADGSRVRRALATRRHADGGLARAAHEDQPYKRRMGWTFLGRPRSAASSTSTSTSRSPNAAARGQDRYNYERGGHAMDMVSVRRWSRQREHGEPTWPRIRQRPA